MRSTLVLLALPVFTLACGETDEQADCIVGEQLNDHDCDGVPYQDDCDDLNPSSTILDNDADCDSVVTADDCDDTNYDMPIGDADCDSTMTADDCDDNDPTSTVVATDGDCDTVLSTDDCDDTIATMPIQDADCDGVITSEDCDDDDTMAGNIALDPECDDLILFGDYTVNAASSAGYLLGYREVTGTLTVGTDQLSHLNDFRDLRRVGALRIISNANLSSFNLPELTHISGDLVVDANPNLASFGLPSLISVNNVHFTNNESLCASTVNALIDTLSGLEWMGTSDISGNADC